MEEKNNVVAPIEQMLASNLVKELVWSEEDSLLVSELWKRGQSLKAQEEEVRLIFQLSKPFIENDDPIGNMLNWEAWRFEFEEENEHHLSLKEGENRLKEDVLSFMNQNLLFFAFAIVERKRRLVDFFEVFHAYPTLEAVEQRIKEIASILDDKGLDVSNRVHLQKTLYGMDGTVL